MTAEAPATTQTVRITEDRKSVILADGRKLPIKAWGKNAAPMVCDPTGKINKGYPTSAYDLIYTQRTGRTLSPAQRAVPQTGVFVGGVLTSTEDDFNQTDPTDFMVYTRRDLASKYPHEHKPGPRTPLFDMATVAVMRSDYWSGSFTLAAIAEKYSISLPTARRFVYGEYVWYA